MRQRELYLRVQVLHGLLTLAILSGNLARLDNLRVHGNDGKHTVLRSRQTPAERGNGQEAAAVCGI